MYISLHNKPATARESGRKGRVTRTVLVLGLVSLLTDVSTEMVTAALPLFVTVGLGLSPMAFGVIDSIYQAATAGARIAGGYVADRWRRPKGVAVCGYGFGLVSKLMLLGVGSVPALSAAIGVDRIGKGMRTGPRDTLIAGASHPEALGRSFGVHRALDTAGALLGPVVAFYLLLAAPANFDMLFVVSACVAALGVLLLVSKVPADSRRPHEPTAVVRLSAIGRILVGNVAVRRLMLAAALLSAMTVSDAFVYLTLLDRGLVPAELFPLLFVATSGVYLLTAIPLGRLADRWSRIGIFVLGHVLIIGVYVLAAELNSVAAAGAALALLGLYYAATDGVLPAATVPLVDSAWRSTAISTLQTVVALGRSTAALTFGLLWSVTGSSTALWIFGAGMAVSILVAAPILIRGKTQYEVREA